MSATLSYVISVWYCTDLTVQLTCVNWECRSVSGYFVMAGDYSSFSQKYLDIFSRPIIHATVPRMWFHSCHSITLNWSRRTITSLIIQLFVYWFRLSLQSCGRMVFSVSSNRNLERDVGSCMLEESFAWQLSISSTRNWYVRYRNVTKSLHCS